MSLLISEISSYLGKKFVGEDFIIERICSISKLKDSSVSFVNKGNHIFDITKESLIILLDGYDVDITNHKCSIIYSKNPRLDFIKIANLLRQSKSHEIAKTAKIGINCQIGENVSVGEYSIIKDNVFIGENTIINSHVVIESNTVVGANCYIKSGSIIGEDGFGFERIENGIPLRFPHIGNVIIGDNVEVGAKVTIAKAALDSTIIKDNVKIDDQVHIAHNCIIEQNVLITACAEISGSVVIGKNSWIGPNSSVKDNTVIGEECFLGVASNISSDLGNGEKVGQLSNLSLRKLVRAKKLLNK